MNIHLDRLTYGLLLVVLAVLLVGAIIGLCVLLGKYPMATIPVVAVATIYGLGALLLAHWKNAMRK